MEVSRRQFAGMFGALVAAIGTIPTPRAAQAKPRNKWTRVRVTLDHETQCYKIIGFHRDKSVPAEQRKQYAVGYRVDAMHLQDLGPEKAKTYLLSLRARAAEQVELAARHMPSEAYLRGPLEEVSYRYMPDDQFAYTEQRF